MSTNWPPYGSMPSPFPGLNPQQQGLQQQPPQQPHGAQPFEQPGLANAFYPPVPPAYAQPFAFNYQAYGQNAPQLYYPQQLPQQQPYQPPYPIQQPPQPQHWTSHQSTDWRGPKDPRGARQDENQLREAFRLDQQQKKEAEEAARKQKNAEEILRSEPNVNTALKTIRDLGRQFPQEYPRIDTPPPLAKDELRPRPPAPRDSLPRNASFVQTVPSSRQDPLTDAAVRNRDSDNMDIQIEDGEVSEGEPMAHGFASGVPVAQSSRVASQAQMDSQRRTTEPSSAFTTASAGLISKHSMGTSTENAQAMDIVHDLTRQREEGIQFIRILHENNIGSNALVNEGLDIDRLRELYRSAGLPFETDSSSAQPQASNGATAQPSDNTDLEPTTGSSSADPRAQYIARLQAAKRAKIGPTVATPKETAYAAPTTKVQAKTPINTKAAESVDETKTRTELIRQRIQNLEKASSPSAEALTAKPSVSHASSNSSLLNPVTSSTTSGNSAVAPANTPAKISIIPGLFMNTPSAAQSNLAQTGGERGVKSLVPNPGSAALPPSVDVKPRPVATTANTTNTSSNSGPGTLRLDVSDAENEGSEMDLSDGHSVNRPVESPPAATYHKPEPKSSAALPSLPARAPVATTDPALLSKTTPRTPNSQARLEQIDDKQLALLRAKAAAKTKLREAREERERKALAAKATQPQADVASPAPPIETFSSNSGTPLAHAVQPPESSRASTKRRREEIESDIPLLDADYDTNTAQIVRLQKELEALVARNKKIDEDRERLKQELQSLGIATEGLSHAELQAKMDESDRRRQPKLGNGTEHSLPFDSGVPSHNQSQASNKAISQSHASTQATGAQSSAPASNMTGTSQPFAIPGLGSSFVTQFKNIPSEGKASTRAVPPKPMGNSSMITTNTPLPPRPVVATVRTNGQMGVEKRLTPGDDDEEDFYSPMPAENGKAETAVANQSVVSPPEEGEVAMSESEGEYEPEEPAPMPDWLPTGTSGGGEHAPGALVPALDRAPIDSSSASSTTSSSDSDSERGSDDMEGVDAQESEGDEGAMDISSSSSSSASPSPSTTHESPDVVEPEANNSVGPSATSPRYETVPAVTTAANEQGCGGGDDKFTGFVPYESPLKTFKAFRFHPNYADFVGNGYNSLTFSHMIDPYQEVCPTDLSGVACINPHCPYQHFKNMSLDGDKLLVQLGTSNPGKSDAEKKRWIQGMQTLLKDLRARNVQGFENIAKEIGNFRRQFLGSDDRVLGI